ncbi:unnamed protein product [Rotaria sp. Silwood1]|nr:unnamed protein product [Rotaria sp. Silwood1]CAF1544328.1 unnamed protein product [Rotaria sp. Silwood1]CAF1578382.1 unnamed protein product [Rotaria sp. Silwood1]CAF3626612.1 unnamed protein product [Rotaria sp. Silwood1]CAF3682524.1 unnamed protein product [Rotaria sp. Silwood1]
MNGQITRLGEKFRGSIIRYALKPDSGVYILGQLGTEASLNVLELVWYHRAPLVASEGWLVLEPNYRRSTGYGDEFLNEIRYRPLSRLGKDILCGVDQLIKDGIVDPQRLAVGGIVMVIF